MLKKLRLFIAICVSAAVLFSAVFLPNPARAQSGGEDFPLIVIGGEPEGIAAAVSAARNGVKTLLIEESSELGGLFTRGRLNFLDMNHGSDKELLTRGIFEEFYESQGNAFDIQAAKQYFLDLVKDEENITLKLNTKFVKPLLEGDRLVGVLVNESGTLKEYKGRRIIDATTDADAAAAAGVPFTVGTEDYGVRNRTMGVTLVFRVKDVNWPYVFLYNNWQRLLSKLNAKWGDPFAGATLKVAWGYGEQALEFKPEDKEMRFRGPNLARQDDGSVLINALLIFGVDSLDPDSRSEGIARGKQEIPHILEFMKEKFAGFKKVKLVDTAEELYVRETRHMTGEYRLTIDDVLENRDQWDRIAHGSYPVDIQPAAPDDLGNVVGKPAIYSVPFRSLIPLKVDNLLVVGRSASYDSLPHGSIRVVPVGMAVGEAAGVAAAYSLDKNMSFREMSKSREAILWVQETLKKQGAHLVEYTPPKPAVMDHWAYSGVKVMRRLGLAAGGYNNNYRLEDEIRYWDANYVVNQTLQRTEYFKPGRAVTEVVFPEGLNRSQLLTGIVQALTGEKMEPDAARQFLKEQGIFTTELDTRYQNNQGAPTFGELYALMGRVFEYLVK